MEIPLIPSLNSSKTRCYDEPASVNKLEHCTKIDQIRRQLGVRIFWTGLLPHVRACRARGVSSLVARLLGDPLLTHAVGEFLGEVRRNGRDSTISGTGMDTHAFMTRMSTTEYGHLTGGYFSGIWELIGASKSQLLSLSSELNRCLERCRCRMSSRELLIRSGYFKGHPAPRCDSLSWVHDNFTHAFGLFGEGSYLDRLAVVGNLYLKVTSRGQHYFMASPRYVCQDLLRSSELDTVAGEFSGAIRSAFTRRVLEAAAIGEYSSVDATEDLDGAFAWVDPDGDLIATPRESSVLSCAETPKAKLLFWRRLEEWMYYDFEVSVV